MSDIHTARPNLRPMRNMGTTGFPSTDVPVRRYGRDVMAGDWKAPRRGRSEPVDASPGLVVEDVESGFCGAVVSTEADLVELEDRRGRRKKFTYGPGFWLDGKPVSLVRARKPAQTKANQATMRARTASGSVAVSGQRARVAAASRIWVEGRHDAELVEKVWGDDLRVEGVVVESLDGIDDLAGIVADFAPGPGRRLGVLVDHLVPGSKESRIAEQATRGPRRAHVLVVGHPFVDVWQSVRPTALGIEAWPVVPRGKPWKEGILDAFGWPSGTQTDVANGWRRILASVSTYADLEPDLLGRVEELIDFVTDPDQT